MVRRKKPYNVVETEIQFHLRKTPMTHILKHLQTDTDQRKVIACFKYLSCSVLYTLKTTHSILSSYLTIKRARKLCTQSKPGTS